MIIIGQSFVIILLIWVVILMGSDEFVDDDLFDEEETLSFIEVNDEGLNQVRLTETIVKNSGIETARITSSVAQKMLRLSDELAGGFYAEHKERPFYPALVEFMTSGPVVVQVLEGEGAILKNRELMGATNPAEADAGTIRADFAKSIDANAVHGSDSPASAAREIAYFFASSDLCSR